MPKLGLAQTELDYSDDGAGEPLVLVHGSASDRRTWHAQCTEFAKHYRVISYSRRYHWPNEKIRDGADYSMEEHLDDLQCVLRLLDVQPAHLVGHSYGAFLAMLVAARKPDLVRSLVLAEPPVITLFVSNSPTPRELFKLLATRPGTAVALIKLGLGGMAPARQLAMRGDAQKAMRAFGKAVLGPEAFAQLSSARLEQVDANAFHAEFLGSGFLPVTPEQIRRIAAPTLLVAGQHSPSIFHRLNGALAELLPHGRKIDIPQASHIMHEDNPAGFNAAVLAFLQEVRGE